MGRPAPRGRGVREHGRAQQRVRQPGQASLAGEDARDQGVVEGRVEGYAVGDRGSLDGVLLAGAREGVQQDQVRGIVGEAGQTRGQRAQRSRADGQRDRQRRGAGSLRRGEQRHDVAEHERVAERLLGQQRGDVGHQLGPGLADLRRR